MDLYERVKVGDTIQMELHKYYDKDDALVCEKLKFPK